MKLSKRQLKRIIREEKAKILSEAIGTGLDGSVSLDHVINCYVNGMSDEECADSMPNDVDAQEIIDFGNFILRAVNKYRDQTNF